MALEALVLVIFYSINLTPGAPYRSRPCCSGASTNSHPGAAASGLPTAAMTPIGSEPLPPSLGQHPTKMQSQRADLLQPVSLPCPQIWLSGSSTEETVPSGLTRYDKLAA